MDLGTRAPRSKTICGDIVLEDMDIVVERVHDDPPAARADTVDVPGRDGTVLREITYEPRNITLECRVFGKRWEDFETIRDSLVTNLMSRGELRLSLRTHPGEYYMAYLASITEGDRVGGTGIGYLELAFVATDPLRYGTVRTAEVPSGGSVTVLVGGNQPAPVSVSSENAVRSSGSLVWGIRADEVDFMHVPTGHQDGVKVTIDAADRSCTVINGTSMITLDSNWLVLAPGRHEVRMDEGTGAATLTWQERSL